MRITVELDDSYDLPAVMRGIAADLEDGFTSGSFPDWKLEGK